MFVRVFAKQEMALVWRPLSELLAWHRENYARVDRWSRRTILRWTDRVTPLARRRTELLDYVFRARVIGAAPAWLPNALGFARLAISPVIVWLLANDHSGLALLLFLCAAATDAIDGEIARRKNCQTPFGKILDPLADKVLFVPAFFAVALPLIPEVLAVLVLAFEAALLIFGCVGWFQSRGKLQKRFRKRRLGANTAGKLKFLCHVTAIALLIAGYTNAATLIIAVACILAVLSLFGHFFILSTNDRHCPQP